MSYHPVTIQRRDPETEQWADALNLHAVQINRAGGAETYGGGAEQYHQRLTFTFRHCAELAALRWSISEHRLVYRGQAFNIDDWDDYMEQHLTVKLTGSAYG